MFSTQIRPQGAGLVNLLVFLQALDQLYEARRILGYSYAFAFYMFGNSMFKEEITEEQNDMNKNLFENQQQDIEGLVSRLLDPRCQEPGHLVHLAEQLSAGSF